MNLIVFLISFLLIPLTSLFDPPHPEFTYFQTCLLRVIKYTTELEPQWIGRVEGLSAKLSYYLRRPDEEVMVPSRNGELLGSWYGAPLADEALKEDEIVLYFFHGGGFISGSSASKTGFFDNLLLRMRQTYGKPFRIFSLDYHLAPEYAFPAPIEEAIDGYQWLIEQQNIPASQICVSGDSTGGTIALSMVLELQKQQLLELPKAMILISPWVDLKMPGKSMITNAATDMYSKSTLIKWRKLYLQGFQADSPLASPARATLKNLPPILIFMGKVECFYDDIMDMCAKIESSPGNHLTKVIHPTMYHDYPVFPLDPASSDAQMEIVHFLALHF